MTPSKRVGDSTGQGCVMGFVTTRDNALVDGVRTVDGSLFIVNSLITAFSPCCPRDACYVTPNRGEIPNARVYGLAAASDMMHPTYPSMTREDRDHGAENHRATSAGAGG